FCPLVAEEPAELLEVGAASGRVHDHEVDVGESSDELPGERLALVQAARVHGKCSAAALRWRNDLEAVGREDPRGGRVDVGKDGALHASGEEADAGAPRTVGRRHPWQFTVP